MRQRFVDQAPRVVMSALLRPNLGQHRPARHCGLEVLPCGVDRRRSKMLRPRRCRRAASEPGRDGHRTRPASAPMPSRPSPLVCGSQMGLGRHRVFRPQLDEAGEELGLEEPLPQAELGRNLPRRLQLVPRRVEATLATPRARLGSAWMSPRPRATRSRCAAGASRRGSVRRPGRPGSAPTARRAVRCPTPRRSGVDLRRPVMPSERRRARPRTPRPGRAGRDTRPARAAPLPRRFDLRTTRAGSRHRR